LLYWKNLDENILRESKDQVNIKASTILNVSVSKYNGLLNLLRISLPVFTVGHIKDLRKRVKLFPSRDGTFGSFEAYA